MSSLRYVYPILAFVSADAPGADADRWWYHTTRVDNPEPQARRRRSLARLARVSRARDARPGPLEGMKPSFRCPLPSSLPRSLRARKASLAFASLQDYLIDLLSAFVNRTGGGGFACDYAFLRRRG